MGDFNAETADTVVSDFCKVYNLKKTRFKNPNNSSCIDLVIESRRKSFQILWLLRQVYLTFTKCAS